MAGNPQFGAQISRADVQSICAALGSGEEHGARSEIIETHFAWVILVGRHAYKLKKAVAIQGFDLRTADARRESCEQELRLNHALAPGIYLDMIPLLRAVNGHFRIDGSGDCVDWLLRMKRLHRAAMLDARLRERAAERSDVVAFANLLARFYCSLTSALPATVSFEQRILRQIDDNESELLSAELSLPAELVRDLADLQRMAHAALVPELKTRHARGRIVEVHGDLRPEHIYLGSPPCVIDRLEFSRDLRTMDPCEELAFLHVECAHAGQAWIADLVLETYLQRSSEHVSQELMCLYASHRAVTRAKVTAWHLRDPAVRHSGPWVERATAYLEQARRYLRPV